LRWSLQCAAESDRPKNRSVLEALGQAGRGWELSFSPLVFAWSDSRRTLYSEFATIQHAARVKREDGRLYGFHDFRRAFATMNADRLTADALQSLMQHKAYTTTQKYINLARQHNATVAALFVPELPKVGVGG
jgi:integrase